MTKRLFPTIKPSHYTLTLKPNFTNFTFEGKERIKFSIKEATDTLTFHSVELSVTSAVLHDGEKEFSPTISYNEAQKTVTFTFFEKLPPGEKTLELEFTGSLGDKMKGFYRSKYIENGEEKYMATTQFEEIGARQAFVCIDEPSAKAVFDITLIVPKDMTAISNTLPVGESVENEEKVVHFSPTPKMSTYILAFIVGEFEFVQAKTKEGVLVRAFATPGKKEQLQFALDVATRTLSFYQEYFAIDYPLPVLDLIAIPDFDAGAMENWGAVTFREAALLIDSEKSSLANKQWVALVVAHELAHMWFGNLVTMEWWTHLWLNEGFACFIEYLAIDELFPKWEMWKQFAVTEHNAALALDSLKYTHPIEVPIDDEDRIKEIFDEISYAKGASVLQMLAGFLGADVFRDGLRQYLKKHAYGNTVTEDLWDALEDVSQKPVQSIMQNWTKQPGYPVIRTSLLDEKIELSQERFFSNPLSQDENKNQIWSIPMRVEHGGKPPEPLLMENTSMVLTGKSNWVKINAQETAVLRTLYTKELYAKLGKAIEAQELSSVDRMGVIRDAFAGAEAGLLSVVDALELLPFYQKEMDYIVWSSVAGGLATVGNLVPHMPKDIQDGFKKYSREIFAVIAQKVGWEKKKDESHIDTLLRGIVLRAYGKYGDTTTIKKAQQLFWDYINKRQVIDSDIRGVVYVLVAENGGEKEWQTLIDLYNSESLHQEKNRIMLALCAFKDKNILGKTLEWSLSGKTEFQAEAVRLQDKSRITLAMFGNPMAQDITWEFIKKHWDYFQATYQGLHGFTRVIEGAGEMVGEKALEDVKAFFADHKITDLERTINQILERIQANTAWLKRDKAKLKAFLVIK